MNPMQERVSGLGTRRLARVLAARRGVIRALSLACLAPLALAAEREALVIGNSEYDIRLPNPVNDAEAVESALKAVGFSVTTQKNLRLRPMQDALLACRRKLTRGALGLFYYAGHGIQVKGESPYTEQLVGVLRSRPAEGLELSEVFREASRAVKRKTGQVPWLNLEASLEKYYLWKASASHQWPAT